LSGGRNVKKKDPNAEAGSWKEPNWFRYEGGGGKISHERKLLGEKRPLSSLHEEKEQITSAA